MAFPVAAAVSGGLSLLGGLIGNSAKRKEAAKDRAFQLQMAQNAHQYEVEDLRKAGLNPILSGTGGPGARASGGSKADQDDPVTPAVNSALSAARAAQELDNLKAQEEKTKVDTEVAQKQGLLLNQQYNQNAFQQLEMNPVLLDQARQTLKNLGETGRKIGAEYLTELEQAKVSGNQARLLKIEAEVQEWMQKHGIQEIGKTLGLGQDFLGILRALFSTGRYLVK